MRRVFNINAHAAVDALHRGMEASLQVTWMRYLLWYECGHRYRSPNPAMLTRTQEILGVFRMFLPSLQYSDTEDPSR